MPSRQDIENFRNAVEVGDDSTVLDLADEMTTEVLKKALSRCKCLVRTTGDYQSTRDIVSDALNRKTF
jgi:hypothetical protein